MARLWRILKIAAWGLGVALVLLTAVLLVNTARLSYDPPAPAEPVLALEALNLDAAAGRLATALSFPTISYQDPAQFDPAPFRALHGFLEDAYPRAHEELTRERVSELSLLYRWTGRDTTLKPILLSAHQDVVPADSGTLDAWTHPPFGGVVSDGYVWGRGALDNKSGLTGLLEAVEWLLTQGFRPERTVYLASGHDEEIGGARGAARIAERLAEEDVALAFALDEGGAITEGAMEEIDVPVAVVGVAEKGYATLELTAHVDGGHSAGPPRRTAVGLLGESIARLERTPFPPQLGTTAEVLDRLGPSLPLAHRVATANRWLFGPLLARRLADNPNTAPLVQTTTAPTMLRAGVKENVLPSRARGTVNYRLLPGHTPQDVLAHARAVIADERVEVRLIDPSITPPPASRHDSDAFRLIERTIHQTSSDGELIVTPYLVPGTTDARHYESVAEDVYRFAAFRLGPADRPRLHGIDERISLEDYARMIRFYVQLIRNAA